MKYLKTYNEYNPLNNSRTVFETDGKYVYETHYSNYADPRSVYYRRKMTIQEYEEKTGYSFVEQAEKGLINEFISK